MLDQLPTLKEKEPPVSPAKPAKPVKKTKAGTKWRVIRGVSLGLATFIIINLLVVLLEPYFLYINSFELTDTAEKILLYQQGPRPDVVFMGSSRVENGMDPDIVEQAVGEKTGVKPRALNLAIPGSGLNINYLLLKNIIQDDKKPSVIVYGLAKLEMEVLPDYNDTYEDITKHIPRSEILFVPTDRARYGGDTLEKQFSFVVNQYIPLLRDNKIILNALDIQFNQQNLYHSNYQEKKTLPANGFRSFDQTLGKAEFEANAEGYKTLLPAFRMDPARIAFLLDFLKLANDRGIKVLLVNMPVNAEHLSFWQNPAKIKEYTDTVQKIAGEYKNTQFVDLYQSAGTYFPPDAFFDSNHLNKKGATILSQMVGRDYLSSYYKVPDPVTKDFYKVKYSDLNLRNRLPPNTYVNGAVSITNLSRTFWPIMGDKKVRLSYHWLNTDDSTLSYEGVRSDFLYSPIPGETQNIKFTVRTPLKPGEYILQLDLLYELVSWYSAVGSPTTQLFITVE